jgi:hypothetical protein
MGTKRNGFRKAFVPGVTDAVEAFYGRVVQPRMPESAAEAIDAVGRDVDAGPVDPLARKRGIVKVNYDDNRLQLHVRRRGWRDGLPSCGVTLLAEDDE